MATEWNANANAFSVPPSTLEQEPSIKTFQVSPPLLRSRAHFSCVHRAPNAQIVAEDIPIFTLSVASIPSHFERSSRAHYLSCRALATAKP